MISSFRFLILLACALFAGAVPAFAQNPDQATGTIRGSVRTEGSGLPIAGAAIEFRHLDGAGRAVTDAGGNYTLPRVPAGRGILRISNLGHKTFDLEVVVPTGREIVLDASLSVQPISLEPVTVEAGSNRQLGDSLPGDPSSLAAARARALEGTSGMAELGIADAVRGIPGNEPPDPGSVLYIRGAATDLKLVFLDGAPVYAPFPLGGLLEPFAPDLLSRTDIYLGGAPARYDGGLSYVMDLRTRGGRARGVHSSGSADLLSARILAEAGVGDRLSVVASARGMHRFGSASLLGDGLPYGYREGLIRGDAAFGETGVLSVTGFGNRETVRLGRAVLEDSLIEWGNQAGSLRLRGDVGRSTAELTLAAGSYSAQLPLGGARPTLAKGTALRQRASLDLATSLAGVQLRYGASIDNQDYSAEATVGRNQAPSRILEAEGKVLGIYGEVTSQPLPRFRFRAGARVDHFSTGEGTALSPRIAGTWLVTDRAAITLAAGRYHQFLRPPDELLLTTAATGAATGASSPPALVVGSATHFTASLDQDLGEGLRLGVEGFYKRFTDVPAASSTDANASGMDFWVRRSSGGIDGWLGYSLAWVWSNRSVQGQGDFTGRHLLSTGLLAPLGQRTHLSMRFAYGAGLPYSAIPLETAVSDFGLTNYTTEATTLTSAERGGTETAPLLQTPDEPFLRLDAELSQRWAPKYGGRTIEIRPYLRVLNSLGRRDSLFYLLDPKRGDSVEAVGALPIIPVLGMEWKF